MSVDIQNAPWFPGGVSTPMSWDPVGKLWMPAPPTPGSITTAMLAPNAVTLTHQAVGVTSNPTSTSTTNVDLPDMVLTFTTPVVCDLLVTLDCSISSSTLPNVAIQLNVDGTDGGNGGGTSPSNLGYCIASIPVNGTAMHLAFTAILQGLPAGAHTIKGRWSTSSGTATAVSTVRYLTAVELRR